METLAYLHVAAAYEEPASIEPTKSHDLNFFEVLNWQKLPTSTRMPLLSIALTLSLLSIASNAMALHRGDQGSQVSALQTQLKATGYYKGPVTGYYGRLTQLAVKTFQKAQGLATTGIAGAKTYATLKKTYHSQSVVHPTKGLLQQGSRGTPVATLQRRMTELGYYKGPITGYYGRLTQVAVKKFQHSKGLLADGRVGPNTVASLI